MNRSRSSTVQKLLITLAAGMLVAPAALTWFPAAASASSTAPSPVTTPSDSWSPKLAYVITTGETRARLSETLRLTKAQDQRLRSLGADLYLAQRAIQRRSDAIVMNDVLTLEQKRAMIASTGYNGSLRSAEESTAARISAVLGIPAATLGTAVAEVWTQDAAQHIGAAVSTAGVSAQGVATGNFHVYATRFTDIPDGVALPDEYAKFANLGWTGRPAGYPAGTYAVSLHWDGVHHGRDNNQNTVVSPPKSVLFAKVMDVGPWNIDDNWWNAYSDPQRPRRINSAGWFVLSYQSGVLTQTWHAIGGKGNLVRSTQLPQGMPEAQAAYFTYFGRPVSIPPHTTNPENYWDKARGYGGKWSGADQYGRQVVSPAAIDLTQPPYSALGMTDNEWIDVTPLWEAPLVQDGKLSMTAGPYLTGNRITFSYTVRNAGTMTGTWSSATFRLHAPDGWRNAGPSSAAFTLAPGQRKTLTFTQILAVAGTWTGYPYVQRAGQWANPGTQAVSLTVGQRTIDRLGGASRYDTAVVISKDAFPKGAPAVVLATGRTFPDALSGAALAGAHGGPLLLVTQPLPASVTAEIRRLHPARVFVLGSGRAVATVTVDAVRTIVPTASVTLLPGVDRFDTARLAAEAVKTQRGGRIPWGTAFLVTGGNFPDAVAASPLATVKNWPVLLTTPTRIPTATAEALASLGITRTIVVGGEKAVSSASLAGTARGVVRLAGMSRYDTAGKVADWATGNGLGPTFTYVGLASGERFPDALTGGLLAGRRWGVMLLTPPSGLPSATRSRFVSHRTVTASLDLYGGTRSLPETIRSAATEALR